MLLVKPLNKSVMQSRLLPIGVLILQQKRQGRHPELNLPTLAVARSKRNLSLAGFFCHVRKSGKQRRSALPHRYSKELPAKRCALVLAQETYLNFRNTCLGAKVGAVNPPFCPEEVKYYEYKPVDKSSCNGRDWALGRHRFASSRQPVLRRDQNDAISFMRC